MLFANQGPKQKQTGKIWRNDTSRTETESIDQNCVRRFFRSQLRRGSHKGEYIGYLILTDILIHLGGSVHITLEKNIHLVSPSTTEAISDDLSPSLKEVVTARQPE